MPRIRSIKPDFFRHEKLQDLENDLPECRVMLTYAGLWTLCDSRGRFEWKPRHIKLDILPFVNFNIENTLSILERNGFISQYEVDGHKYGVVWTFGKHQRLTGKELTQGEKYPEPNVKQQGNIGEAPVKHPESQEREREREEEKERGVGKTKTPPPETTSGKPARKKPPAKTPLPSEFKISDRVKKWSLQNGHVSLDRHYEYFIGYVTANGKTYADWDQAFMNAIRDNWAKVGIAGSNGGRPQQQAPLPYIPPISSTSGFEDDAP